jgi:hypothetical protein
MLPCGTGVLPAARNVKDHYHDACVALLCNAEGPLLVPSPVPGETGPCRVAARVAGAGVLAGRGATAPEA